MNWKDIKKLIKEELKGGKLILNEIDVCKCGDACADRTEGDCYKCCNDIHPTGWPTGKKSKEQSTKKKSVKEASVTAKDTQFNLRTGVNKNPTKLGIKIQFEPSSGKQMNRDTLAALEIALQEKLNDSLKKYEIQVSKDTDVPRPNVIGFFIPLAQVKNLIVTSLGGQTEEPTVPAPEPETEPTPQTQTAPSASPAVPTADQMVNEQIINEMRVRDLNEISKVVNKDDFYTFINAGNNIVRTLEENGISRPKKYLEYLTKHNIM